MFLIMEVSALHSSLFENARFPLQNFDLCLVGASQQNSYRWEPQKKKMHGLIQLFVASVYGVKNLKIIFLLAVLLFLACGRCLHLN